MADNVDPLSAANVFAGQMMALIGLATALVECGAVKSEALIGSLERQMNRHKADGADATLAVPLVTLIQTLRHEVTRLN